MAAPGRVVLWPAVAGLLCRQVWRGWDHTSVPRPGVGCLPSWEGSSRGFWAHRRRETEAGQHGVRLQVLMRSSPYNPGPCSRSGTGASPTGAAFPNVDNPITGLAPIESSGVGRGPPVTRLRIWRLGVRILAAHHQNPLVRGPVTRSRSAREPPDRDQTATTSAGTPWATATTCTTMGRRLHCSWSAAA
jgi:hypothetical protein